MGLSRRNFLRQSAGLAGLVLAGQLPIAAAVDQNLILVNHVGFTPEAAKHCLLEGRRASDFEVVEAGSGQLVFRGQMKPVAGDLGEYLVGDFSGMKKAGAFRIISGAARSRAFSVAGNIYESALGKCVSYFSRQRCGNSKTGYHAPCHLDDGRRLDNGHRQDVAGGWHDACDVRKWVNATLYGMSGLSRVLDTGALPDQRPRILEELRWGNQYFQKMQEPAGYVMDFCGGDDGNHWTDNRPGTADDRAIHTDACELPSQFHFIAAQAALVRHARDEDAPYAHDCEQAARRCLQWCLSQPMEFTQSLSSAILAMVEMHRTFGGEEFRDLAAQFLKKLLALQTSGADQISRGISGYFRAEPGNPQPLRAIMHGNLPLLALCESIEYLSEHPDAPRWRDSLQSQADYLIVMSERAAFGTIPFGLYLEQDPGGNRRIGNCWYRWTMKPRDEHPNSDNWWVGINAHLTSHGVGLIKASRLLKSPRLSQLAQSQFDWVLGVNPFDVSTMTDVGSNQPELFVTDEFRPATPPIPGGVTNGLGGTTGDEITVSPGSYNTCEYWTPMTAYTMWLMAELGKSPA
jgi:hypothetical protein